LVLTLAVLFGGLSCFFTQTVEAAFPGANGSIAFESAQNATSTTVEQILKVGSDGSNLVNLISALGENTVEPNWSANGSKLIYTSDQIGAPGIYTVNADGTNKSRIVASDGSDFDPAFSPDGSKIVFTSSRDGNQEIYVANVDGTGATRLTNSAGNDHSPRFSPDGTQIAFTSRRDGNNEIYKMNADGTAQTRLTTDGNVDRDPDFSPDGTQIVFRSDRDGNNEIYKMNADGTAQTRLTVDENPNMDPVFSPDGTQIAYTAGIDSLSGRRIYRMNADGSSQTEVLADVQGTEPSWQPVANSNIGVSIAAEKSEAFINEEQTFTITVTNTGAAAMSGVTATAYFESTTISSVTPSKGACSQSDSSNISCSFDQLAAGESVTVSVVAKATAVGEPSATAQIGTWGPETDSNDNSATLKVVVEQDSKSPTASILKPKCPTKYRGRRVSKSKCDRLKLKYKRDAWRTLRIKAKDSSPSMGIAKVQVNIVRRDSKKTCTPLTEKNGSLLFKKRKCSKSVFDLWVDAKAVTSTSKSYPTMTHYLKLPKLSKPRDRKRGDLYYFRIKVTDVAGNVSTLRNTSPLSSGFKSHDREKRYRILQ